MALLDLGLKCIVEMHNLFVVTNEKSIKHFSHLVLTAKMSSLLVAMRKMLYSGLVDAVKCINRPFIETIDLFYVCLINTDFSKKFGNTQEMYDNTAFWHKNISKGKLKNDIHKLFLLLSSNEQYLKNFDERRKSQQNFLSNSLHGSLNSAFSNYAMISLDLSGYSTDVFGKVTTAYPNLLLSLLEDINLLLQIMDLAFQKKLPILQDINLKKHTLYFYHSNNFEILYANNVIKFSNHADEILKSFKK